MVKLLGLLVVTMRLVCALPQAQPPPATSPADATLTESTSSAIASAGLKPYVTPLSTDEIKEWDVLGDSFTAGTRSNHLYGFQSISQDCSRYNKAFPTHMNADSRWPGNAADRRLNFGACSSNKTDDLMSKRVRFEALQSPYVSSG